MSGPDYCPDCTCESPCSGCMDWPARECQTSTEGFVHDLVIHRRIEQVGKAQLLAGRLLARHWSTWLMSARTKAAILTLDAEVDRLRQAAITQGVTVPVRSGTGS